MDVIGRLNEDIANVEWELGHLKDNALCAADEITRLRKLHSETHYKMLLYEAERDKLREQLAATQAECIALQNRMDEQVTAWRAEWMAAENKLAETDALPLPAAPEDETK